MRAQASKNVSKKTAIVKPKFKQNVIPAKQVKKKVTKVIAKQKNNSPKTGFKTPKLNVNKPKTSPKDDSDVKVADDANKKATHKSPVPTRNNSSVRKIKPSEDEHPNPSVPNEKKVGRKAVKKIERKDGLKGTVTKSKPGNDHVKNKINTLKAKQKTANTKAKIIMKKGDKNVKKDVKEKRKKNRNVPKDVTEVSQMEKNKSELFQSSETSDEKTETLKRTEAQIESSDSVVKKATADVQKGPDTKSVKQQIPASPDEIPLNNTEIGNLVSKTSRTEVERPPKFFTSTRSPKIVDIDIKNFKTIKASVLNVNDKYEMKPNSKKNEAKDQEIDVYTFTDFKADSPKSIIAELSNNKIGKVRPIARVKGTIVDRKIDLERKKHFKPIEEVVNKLKAGKTSDDSNRSAFVEPPKPQQTEGPVSSIVSKSYKMVPRKTGLAKNVINKSNGNEKLSTAKTAAQKKPKQQKADKKESSDDEIETSTFSFNHAQTENTSSDESVAESSDDSTVKACKKAVKKDALKLEQNKSESSKSSESDLSPKMSKRRLKLISMWTGPKKHRMASLNALAKVHCLYENESRSHLELGLMKTIERSIPLTSTITKPPSKLQRKKLSKPSKPDSSESEFEEKAKPDTESSDEDPAPTRKLRDAPGSRGAGKYWDPKTSSSEESEAEHRRRATMATKIEPKDLMKSEPDSKLSKGKKVKPLPPKKRRRRAEVTMDFKDMVVQKRMASLNASAILAASYEKRSPKSSKDETTTDSNSDKDETYAKTTKSTSEPEVKVEPMLKPEEAKSDENSSKQKMELIVNQDTDVTITGVYSTHHEGFCTVSGLKYMFSSTSHTQTLATAASSEKKEDTAPAAHRYTPLGALSSMQPPPDQELSGPTGPEHQGGLVGLGRRAGFSSAFSAPSSTNQPPHHHEQGKLSQRTPPLYDRLQLSPLGYYQPAGPLLKEQSGVVRPDPNPDEERRALARYHPHYHGPPVLPGYANPYYGPGDMCYGRYYRPAGAPLCPDAALQLPPAPPDAYPPPQYYPGPPGPPPCYRHEPHRVPPYLDYRSCSCTAPPQQQTHSKNVHTGPTIGKPPISGGPVDAKEAFGGAFRPAARARRLPLPPSSGKDPPAAANAPLLCTAPQLISGASPKREFIQEPTFNPGLFGPPSPARGSAGACVPQPPTQPRKARIGKAMARKSLSGDDTASLLNRPPAPPPPDLDDDVAVISPNVECIPIDLSSSDETGETRDSPPRKPVVIDVKKENEEPARIAVTNQNISIVKKSPVPVETQALRERNAATHTITRESPIKLPEYPRDNNVKIPETPLVQAQSLIATSTPKLPAKRRFSKPKLEVELDPEATFDETKPNNCIGEHVKLQKRRKTITESQPSFETIDNKNSQNTTEAVVDSKIDETHKKGHKRKSNTIVEVPPIKVKKIIVTNRVTPLQVTPITKVTETKKSDTSKPKKVETALKPTTPAVENECSQPVKINETETETKVHSTIKDESNKQSEKKIKKRKKKRSTLLLAEPKDKKQEKEKVFITPEALYIPTKKSLNINNNFVDNATNSEPKKSKVKKQTKRRQSVCTKVDEVVICGPNVGPKWSNGWRWEGEPYLSKVYLNNDPRLTCMRRCWPSMVHDCGDCVRRGDAILLRANARRGEERPYVARVATLWENDEREMMVSLLWYYRPEHTDGGRRPEDAPDEVFASKHRDANSVACIEDKCYVLTFNEYCRYRRRLKAKQQGVTEPRSIVPLMPVQHEANRYDSRVPPTVPPELVLFCHKVYDFKTKKVMIPVLK